MLCPLPYGIVVLLCPALLQPDNVRRRLRRGDLDPDFREALIALLGDELEAPAIEGEDPDAGRRATGFRGHCEDCMVYGL